MITKEKLEHHITHLEDKLKSLRAECKEAYALGTDVEHERLKKEKLKIKDEIESFKKKIDEL